MNLSEPFIRRPVATTLMMAALAFVGIVAFPFLPVAPLPQVDFPTIQVTTTWTGASAETMATSVAAPLKQQFGQIAGITQMTSQSALGSATIVIQSISTVTSIPPRRTCRPPSQSPARRCRNR